MKKDEKYSLAKELMPFPSYDALFGALHSMALLLSGITSGKLEMTEGIIQETKEVLEFVATVQSMMETDRFSEFLDRDNERVHMEINDACHDHGVDYEEARAMIRANSEIGQRRFDMSVDKATKKKN